eukprot:6795395-Prymnesium_polylepis.1
MFGTNARTRCERVLEATARPPQTGVRHRDASRRVCHRGHVPAYSSAGSPFPCVFLKLKTASCPIPVHARPVPECNTSSRRVSAVSLSALSPCSPRELCETRAVFNS